MRGEQYALTSWSSVLFLAHQALAQTTTISPTSTTKPATLTRAYGGSSFPGLSSLAPTSTDDAGNGNNNKNSNESGVVQYYFVFLALLLCCVGLAIFFLCRNRSRRRARRGNTSGRESSASQRNYGGAGAWYGGLPRQPARAYAGRYWQGRWGDTSREEGLNEHGEAPPAYVPKRQSQEQGGGGRTGDHEVAIPMDDLARERAGMKPPEYSEAGSRDTEPREEPSAASASSPGLVSERPTNS